jgi:hypothetical protein
MKLHQLTSRILVFERWRKDNTTIIIRHNRTQGWGGRGTGLLVRELLDADMNGEQEPLFNTTVNTKHWSLVRVPLSPQRSVPSVRSSR